MSIKAVIFDLDGTITEPFLDFDKIREEMGLGPDAGAVWEVMAEMGAGERSKAEKILGFYEQKAVAESTLNRGAKETLEKLVEAGVRVGILTRNTQANALAVCEKHGLKFEIVVGREDGPVKPDAFGVLRICEWFGVKPEKTIMAGDYLYDMLCAKSAGAVAVLLANHDRAGEFAEYADFVIENLSEILQIIADSA